MANRRRRTWAHAANQIENALMTMSITKMFFLMLFLICVIISCVTLIIWLTLPGHRPIFQLHDRIIEADSTINIKDDNVDEYMKIDFVTYSKWPAIRTKPITDWVSIKKDCYRKPF